MKKYTLLWSVVSLLYFTLNTLHANEQTVVLQVNESAPIWSKNLPSGGLGVEIVQAISQEMGIKTYIEFIPLKRLIANTSNNDIGNPLFYMNNQEFAAIIPIAVSYSSFFTYKKTVGKLLSETLPKERRIGILKGTNPNIKISEQFGVFEESTSQESLFKKLKAGRLDLVVELNLVGTEMIRKLFPNEVKNFDSSVVLDSSSPIAIMIDISYPNANAIALLYQKGLDRIIKNGVYEKILEKYYVKSSIPYNWYHNLSKFKTLYSIDIEGSL